MAEKMATLRLLMWWCVLAQDHRRQRTHLAQLLDVDLCPGSEYLRARKVHQRPSLADVKADDVLDQEELRTSAIWQQGQWWTE